MKLFIPLSIHPYRRQTFPLLKLYFSKLGILKHAVGEMFLRDITFVKKMEDCDKVVLPMSWNFYRQNHQIEKVHLLIKQAQSLNKEVLSFTTGDYGIKIADFENLTVLRASGNRSKLSKNHQGLPAFIEDPLKRIFPDDELLLQPYTQHPKIGFCGMANTSVGYALEELGRIYRRNFKYYMSVSKHLPQDLLPTTYRRAQLLMQFKKSPLVEDQFIFRKKYQAGAQTEEEKERASREFFQNIKDNQYVLCFRGAGNFSVRLYETLAMGRIPIFVNTDCILPMPTKIDWKKHVVWIEYKDREKIVDYLIDFHKQHNEDSFKKLQESNRKLWENSLTLQGFFNTFFSDKKTE